MSSGTRGSASPGSGVRDKSSQGTVGNVRKRTRIVNEKKIAEDEFMAAAIGDVEWLRQSLRGNRGAINYDKNGLAPIHLAAVHGRLDCLKLLIEKFKVNVNLPSSTGWRPIHLCISNGTGKRAYQCLHYLLSVEADPSVTNEDGITPAHQASSEGHVQCLKALIEEGAKINTEDRRGHRPLDLAKLWGHRKCARLLAMEIWHQEKDHVAKEMHQLKKLKMQQVLHEIEADEDLKAAQQLYGDQAFEEWLQSRGMSRTQTGPNIGGRQGRERGGSEGVRSTGQGIRQEVKGQVRGTPQRESTYKANSAKAPSIKPTASRESSQVAPVKQVQIAEKSPSMGPRQISSLQGSEESTNLALYEKDTPPEEQKEETAAITSLHPSRWNVSTKFPEKPYINNLGDYYPRDVYTMHPRYPPKRASRSPTLIMADEAPRERSGKKTPGGTAIPPERLQTALAEGKPKERPVVYKCKNIIDVQQRRIYDIDQLPRDEGGLHLTDDCTSLLFKRGLLPERIPSTASTAISDISNWSGRDKDVLAERIDMPGVLQAMRRMHKQKRLPDHFPDIRGEEYDLNMGQLAAI